MNNKGFIATSLIYSFFLIFITLFLTIIADYLQNKVLLNTIEEGIKDTINSTRGIEDFKVGDILYFATPSNVTINGQTIVKESTWLISSVNNEDKSLTLYSMEQERGLNLSSCNSDNCVNITLLQSDLENSATNSPTKQFEILNTFNFKDPMNESNVYSYYIIDETNTTRVITKNCLKILNNALNYDDCSTVGDSNTKYRNRMIISVLNKKFTVTPSGSNNFTVTGVS